MIARVDGRLRAHGRYDYSPIVGRPAFEWPGGKRLARLFDELELPATVPLNSAAKREQVWLTTAGAIARHYAATAAAG